MSKYSKPILIVFAAVFGGAAFVLIGVNLYLQSEVVQERLRKATAASAGVPVDIRGASYTPWTGLTLSGISAEDPERPGRKIFEIRRLNVRLALWPLLSKKVVITSLSLADPVVVVPESNPAVPLPPTRGEVVVEELPADIPKVSAEEAVGVDLAEGSPQPTPKPLVRREPMRFTIEIENLRVHNGMIVVRGENGANVAVLSGIEVQSKVPTDLEASGEIRVAEAALGGRFFVRNFRSPFRRQAGRVSLTDYSADVGTGKWGGNFSMIESSGAFELDGKLDGVVAAELLRDAGMPHGRAQGSLSGEFQIAGGAEREHPDGTASFRLLNAVLEPVDFLKQLGQILRIEELQLLQLEDARMELTIGGGGVYVDTLRLQSENLILGAEGPIENSGEMDLSAKLMINRNLQQNLGGLIGRNFVDSEEEGYKELPFRISGPIHRPRTDLLDRLAGVRIGGEVGRFLQNLFGAPPKNKKQDD